MDSNTHSPISIGIIDYGLGNLGSVANALARLEVPSRFVKEPSELAGCSALILPGVGAFGDCMKNLAAHGFVVPLRDWILSGRPLLGICLGLQIFCESSEESPGAAGLGLLPVHCRVFEPAPPLKVPLIGWNPVAYPTTPPHPLFDGIPAGTHFYFVHSYYLPHPADVSVLAPYAIATASHTVPYTAAIALHRAAAVQFHPEKSQAAGLRLLQNFLSWSTALQ